MAKAITNKKSIFSSFSVTNVCDGIHEFRLCGIIFSTRNNNLAGKITSYLRNAIYAGMEEEQVLKKMLSYKSLTKRNEHA